MDRLVGIDPGLNNTGYACVELGRDGPAIVEAGVFSLSRGTPMEVRLVQLFDDLGSVLDELKPRHLIVERLFSHYRHASTAILMGHARGVVLLAGARRGLTLGQLAPSEVKKSIAGHGQATKEQMQRAVMLQCGLSEPPEPHDVADAIAIALCGRIGWPEARRSNRPR